MASEQNSNPTPSNNAHQQLKNNTIIVVLGASGDLAKKKTFPALFGLYVNDFLPPQCHIVGYARTKMTEEEFHKRISQFMNKLPARIVKEKLENFLKMCSYISGQYDQDADFKRLDDHMGTIEKKLYPDETRNRLFYMALPPSVFISVAKGLKNNCYIPSGGGINRIVVEKPFGKDLESSRDMMGKLKQLWREDETFRIDHYLGKEMVKNLLVLRFGNVIVDASLNKNLVDNVQITFKEPFGTEGRGGYFDEFNIIRDIMQNHLMQILSILAMERPVSFEAEDIRDEKVKLLRYIKPIEREHVLLGQYVASHDKSKPGYLDDETVPKGSVCPTFAAVVVFINSPRWEGVPFILKAGKALNSQKAEIRVQFKDVTSGLFKDIARNELVIRVQPDEAVYLKMNTKTPGLKMCAIPTEMDLTYRRRFSDLKIPEAYESLILDALKGDHSNFVRDDELDIAWKIFTPTLHWIEETKPKPLPYEYGSRGPNELDSFVEKYVGYKRTSSLYQWPVTQTASL